MKLVLKNAIITTLLIVVTTIFATPTDELIRTKVEGLTQTKTLNNTYKIYCAVSLREIYLTKEFTPIWKDQKQITDFTNIIEKCDNQGFNPNDYHLADIKSLSGSTNTNDKLNLDIILSDAFILYTSHLLSGKTNPVTINAEWHIIKTEKNPLDYLSRINNSPVETIIAELRPKNSNYLLLQKQLILYKQLANNGGWNKIEMGAPLTLGMSDQRIEQIKKRLNISGDYSGSITNEPNLYNDTLKQAVINFQRRHGLEALGKIGNQTIEKMNISVEEKIKTIEINLERYRWLPQILPSYCLMVNIANFELDVIKNSQIIKKHKVIVGKTVRKTPVFSSTMQYIVFNPTWTVPPTILKNDLIPAVSKNSNYLKDKNIFVYDSKGAKVDQSLINWKSSEAMSYTYRQDPGKINSLGAVKFIFPNSDNVYLHDTPTKELFDKTERAFSSGCIRVQKPLELAELLLVDQPKWTKETINKTIETGATQTVYLSTKPEVFLLYLTSWVDDNGIINFRSDIYERDQNIYNALNEEPM